MLILLVCIFYYIIIVTNSEQEHRLLNIVPWILSNCMPMPRNKGRSLNSVLYFVVVTIIISLTFCISKDHLRYTIWITYLVDLQELICTNNESINIFREIPTKCNCNWQMVGNIYLQKINCNVVRLKDNCGGGAFNFHCECNQPIYLLPTRATLQP